MHLHDRPGGLGPADPPPVDAVFIDSSHELEETVATFRTWEPALEPGGVVGFHDYADDAYPGVTQAVRSARPARARRAAICSSGASPASARLRPTGSIVSVNA